MIQQRNHDIVGVNLISFPFQQTNDVMIVALSLLVGLYQRKVHSSVVDTGMLIWTRVYYNVIVAWRNDVAYWLLLVCIDEGFSL